MPVCKNCGNRISKFDKDMCPICGCKKPLEGVSSETVEVTSAFDLNSNEYKKTKIKTRKTLLFLTGFLGFLGVPFVYLKDIKGWGICFGGTLFLYLLSSFLLMFLSPLKGFGFLVSSAILFAVNIGLFVFFITKQSLKDKSGELLK